MAMLMEHKDILSERQAAYSLLARLYRSEVDDVTYEKLLQLDLGSLEDVSEGYKLIHSYINNSGTAPVTELAVDYAKVFLGAGCSEKFTCATPFESVYTSKGRLVMQEARDMAVRFYRQNGVEIDKNIHEPEDHIAFELEFMAQLCAQTINALDNKAETAHKLAEQKAFLTEHLLNWVPEFCLDIARFADTDFYKGLGIITTDFISIDLEILNELIEQYPQD